MATCSFFPFKRKTRKTWHRSYSQSNSPWVKIRVTAHESKLSHTKNYHKNNSHLDDTIWKLITALEHKGMNEPTNWSLHIFLTLKRRAGQLNGLVHKFPGRGRPHRARAPQLHLPVSDSTARCQAEEWPPLQMEQGEEHSPGLLLPIELCPQINTGDGKVTRIPGWGTSHSSWSFSNSKRSARCHKTGVILATSFEKAKCSPRLM